MSEIQHKKRDSGFEVELLSGWRQWLCFVMLCGGVFGFSVWFEYDNYRLYASSQQSQEVFAQVIAQYPKTKNGTDFYQVLKLKTSSGALLFTTSKEDLQDISYRFVRIYGKGLECSFIQYLKSCFMSSYRISLNAHRDYRDVLRQWVDSQHNSKSVAGFYKTLFFADFLHYEWRHLSNKLGISHIIAISGFHLGILSVVVGGLLHLVYNLFHRYVGYRNRVYDIGFVVLVCLFAYLIVLDFSPSFLRAFVMALIGFVVLYSGVRLLSFQLLCVVTCLCIAFFPRLIFSVGFVLSVSGVFFIYLFIRHLHIDSMRNWWRKYILIPIWFNSVIFINMLIVVHWFFPYFTPLILISIPLTLLFVIFFPLIIMLHLFGFGGLFDEFFEWVKGCEIPVIEFYTPWWLLGMVVGLCIVAAWRAWAYKILNLLSCGFFVFLCWMFYWSGSSLW